MNPAASGSLRDRFRGALVGIAVGDALGAPVEGRHDVPASYLKSLEGDPPNLRYTDDTAMTIGVARSLVECGRFDGGHMAESLAEIYTREPWRGYGAGPPRVFSAMAGGTPWDRAARDLFGGEGSYGNGGAMRVAPVSLHAFPNIGRTAETARLAATITHTHPEGLDGAAAQAVAISVVLGSEGPISATELISTLVEHVGTSVFHSKLRHIEHAIGARPLDELADVLGTGIAARSSVPTALACFLTHQDSFAAAVTAAIGLGGDTDTIAAMAGALAGAMHGYAAVPPTWKAVEGGDELVELADALASSHDVP